MSDNEFEDDQIIDDDLADDWEAELAAEEEAEAKAKAAAELAAAGGKKPKRHHGHGGGGDAEYEEDEEPGAEDENETEEERRARIELQRQMEAARAAKEIFGGSSSSSSGAGSAGSGGSSYHSAADIRDLPPLATWETPCKTIEQLREYKERVVEVVARNRKNPNFTACLVPCFTALFKNLDTATTEQVRSYLETSCKENIEEKRALEKQRMQEAKAKALAERLAREKEAAEERKEEKQQASSSSSSSSGAGDNKTRSNQRAREAADLFGGVEDKAGVNENEDEYSMF